MTEIKPGTPLPWAATISGDEVELHDTNLEGQFELYVYSLTDGITLSAQDARYIAHACNAYPSLITGLREARDALDEIADPVAAMHRKAMADGLDVDGVWAVRLSSDAEYLKGIARSALAHLDTLLANQEDGS